MKKYREKIIQIISILILLLIIVCLYIFFDLTNKERSFSTITYESILLPEQTPDTKPVTLSEEECKTMKELQENAEKAITIDPEKQYSLKKTYLIYADRLKSFGYSLVEYPVTESSYLDIYKANLEGRDVWLQNNEVDLRLIDKDGNIIIDSFLTRIYSDFEYEHATIADLFSVSTDGKIYINVLNVGRSWHWLGMYVFDLESHQLKKISSPPFDSYKYNIIKKSDDGNSYIFNDLYNIYRTDLRSDTTDKLFSVNIVSETLLSLYREEYEGSPTRKTNIILSDDKIYIGIYDWSQDLYGNQIKINLYGGGEPFIENASCVSWEIKPKFIRYDIYNISDDLMLE